jgi:hypothetical protein
MPDEEALCPDELAEADALVTGLLSDSRTPFDR